MVCINKGEGWAFGCSSHQSIGQATPAFDVGITAVEQASNVCAYGKYCAVTFVDRHELVVVETHRYLATYQVWTYLQEMTVFL